MLMIRDEQWKFNYCELDPPQLFNLEEDPHELNNLALEPEYQALVEQFTNNVKQRWNVELFREQVIDSQQNRLKVYQGLRQGNFEAWDYQPKQDASQRFMRNHLDLNIVEANAPLST